MCYIKAKDFDRARQVLGQCNQREAATQYVTFLAAAEQGELRTWAELTTNIRSSRHG
jgi:hypothetical protein